MQSTNPPSWHLIRRVDRGFKSRFKSQVNKNKYLVFPRRNQKFIVAEGSRSDLELCRGDSGLTS